MSKFIVDRSGWRCGGQVYADCTLTTRNPNRRGEGPSQLLNQDGYKCCLGFVGLQDGYTEPDIVLLGEPSEITSNLQTNAITVFDPDVECESGYLYDTELAQAAMITNDDMSIGDAEREHALIDLFEEHGHELVFVGEFAEV